MNILVTGGRGQLGLSLQKVADQFPNLHLIFTDMPEVDITDSSNLRMVVTANDCKAIINCAAYTAVDKAESEPALAAKINTEGPAVLASVCKELDLALIHVSTDYVFNGASYSPLKETDSAENPLGVYGSTKRDGEKVIESSGCRATIVRTAWLYSEFGSNFVKTMLRLSETKNELGVICDQVGSPTYAPDLAKALLNLVSDTITGFDIYHYTNEGVCSWYDFALAVFEITGRPVKVNPLETWQYPTPASRPYYSVLNKAKIKEKGIAVPYWRDSLKECINILSR